jgi:hypothetical protein
MQSGPQQGVGGQQGQQLEGQQGVGHWLQLMLEFGI